MEGQTEMGLNNNNNTNNNTVTNTKLIKNNNNNIVRAAEIEATARKLVEKYNSPESFDFYCKIAWKLPESYIWRNYEQSQKARNPGALFNFLCRKDLNAIQ
jgi:hypothetical protein